MSNFRIIGDEIEYEFRPFARIVAPDFSVFRFDAIEEIEMCDFAEVESEHAEWCANVTAEHAKEIETLESRIKELEAENMKLVGLLDEIEGGSTVAEMIAAAHKERDDWRKIAETNRAAYYEAIKPKPRKRRATPTGA